MLDYIKSFLNKHFKTLVFFGLAGLIGGFFVGVYQLDSYPEEIRQQILSQGLNEVILGVVTALQAAGYGVFLGAIGIFLGERLGLYKGERRLELKPLFYTVIVLIVGGLSMILFDVLWFGRVSAPIMESYSVKPTIPFMIASVIYGGVIEEVMLRLFMLTLIAFILHKIFGKGSETPTTAILVIANVVASLLFAAAHLPATEILFGLTPIIVFRCFLLNGGIGVMFGWLYHRYGLRYSMIAHAGCHVVSKLIWILFI